MLHASLTKEMLQFDKNIIQSKSKASIADSGVALVAQLHAHSALDTNPTLST